MDKARAIFAQLAAFWRRLSNPKRLALVFGTVGVLVATLALSYLSSRETYGYLYTELSPEDAANIVEKLKAQQIPYKLEASGTAVQVPEDRVAALRLELAASGLPRGGSIGFEIFDKSQIGATEFEQQVSLRRALEGELIRSIMTVEGVKGARVHLVMPERRLFASAENSASASVVLKLDHPQNFGRREVNAIVHLVVSAVPGLAHDRVSVVSTEGVTLHRPNAGQPGGASDVEAERARTVAAQMESDVRAQLENVVGAGNADVRVNVRLDPTARERSEEHYEPSKVALRSEQKVEEYNGSGDPGVAGVPGAVSNLPDARDAAGAPVETETTGAPGNVFRRSHTRNWEVDVVKEKSTTPAGEVDRVSVAVLLNHKQINKGGKLVTVPRGPEELANLEELVKRAVGFDTERGDSVKLTSAPFARMDEPVVETGPQIPDWLKKWWPYLAGAAGALLAILAACVLVWKRRRAKKKAAKSALVLEAKANTAALTDIPSPLQLPESQHVDAPELRARALQLAAEDPATAAVVLRKWLNAS